MRIVVDEVMCQAHGMCALTAPNFFSLRDDDGQAEVRNDGEVPPDQEVAVADAVSGCPEQAITIA
jgi:ferredoxin